MRVAVLGATGLVGGIMVRLLESRAWADGEPLLLTSARSAGREVTWRGGRLACRDAATVDWREVDLALFSAGAEAGRRYGAAARAAGAWVVDNSSAWRREAGVPLVVPEINGPLVPALAGAGKAAPAGRGGIVANPNCSTIQIALAVAPLRDAFGLREVHVTTLQAVSGAGGQAVRELAAQVVAEGDGPAGRVLAGDLSLPPPPPPPGTSPVLPRPLAGDALPAIGRPLPDGSYEEEDKVGRELRRILDEPDLHATCTAVRVPAWNGHAAAVRAVLGRAAGRDEVVAALRGAAGLAVAADPHAFATQREASGGPEVRVGRVRSDGRHPDACLLWVVADNLLKGAAWNALQIADLLAGVGRTPAAP